MNALRSTRTVPILFFLWNIIGILAYIMQSRMDLAALSRQDPYQAHMFAHMPHWAWAAYAVAVFSAFLASLLLVMRRRFAPMLYAISLIAVLIQFSYAFFLTDLIAVKGFGAAIFPIVIIALAIVQWLYARAMARKGLLN
jgi:hypothetical protein